MAEASTVLVFDDGEWTHLVFTKRRGKGLDRLLACGVAQGPRDHRQRYWHTEDLMVVDCVDCAEIVDSVFVWDEGLTAG